MDFLVTVAAADTSWPDAAIAIAGILLVTAVSVVVIWQGLATLRTRIEAGRTGKREPSGGPGEAGR
jgi:hypothetical protein